MAMYGIQSPSHAGSTAVLEPAVGVAPPIAGPDALSHRGPTKATGPRASTLNANESGNLDFLRAFAVLAVFGGHLWFTLGPQFVEIRALAHLGVVAFFVHTAFVLMSSLSRLDADGKGTVVFRFYVRRVFRIYPLSILCVVVVLLASIPWVPWVAYDASNAGWKRIVANLALVQNIKDDQASVLGVLWSLPYEVQMYALLPVVFFLESRYAGKAMPALLAAGVVLASIPRISHLTVYFPCFLSGCLSYSLSRRYRP